MKVLTVAEAQADFYKLLDEVALSNKPIKITSSIGDVVLISAKVWKEINKAVYSSLASDWHYSKDNSWIKTESNKCLDIELFFLYKYTSTLKRIYMPIL